MPPPTESDIDSAISVLDKDKNNEISLEEFESWWQMMQYTPSRPQRRCARAGSQKQPCSRALVIGILLTRSP